jgi:transposase-like protein
MFANSKLSNYRIGKIIDHFCVDIDATRTALLLKLNRKTVNRYFMAFRLLVRAHQDSLMERMLGVVEVDESYFGPSRARGRPGPRKRGRGTAKQPVFGIYEREGRVYTEIVPDCSKATLQAIIRGKVSPESVINSDGWKGYDGLVDVGYDRHFRINKTIHFAEKSVHVNGIEAFWSFAKRRLAKFNGTKVNFQLHLKECEWRYGQELPELIASLRKLVTKNKTLMV